MDSALKMSLKFGIPIGKIKEIWYYLDIDLDDEDFESDKGFEQIVRAVKLRRTSAYTLAYIHSHCSSDQCDFIFDNYPEFEYIYSRAGFPIDDRDILPGASRLLRRLHEGQAVIQSDYITLAEHIKAIIGRADEPVEHVYLAVRLLLSLPDIMRKDFTKPVASILNKTRHHGHLAGWFTMKEREMKNYVEYHIPAFEDHIPALDITEDEIASFSRRLGSDDPVKLAGIIHYEKKLNFKDVEKFLKNRKKEFDL
jgi:hypothetical protein